MSQYLLAVNHNEADAVEIAAMTPEQMQPMFDATGLFTDKLREAGAFVFVGGLHPREVATVVDGTGATPLVTDGPYSESKEYLGGLWIIDVADLDAAIEWAGQGSKACGLPVEVRPFQE